MDCHLPRTRIPQTHKKQGNFIFLQCGAPKCYVSWFITQGSLSTKNHCEIVVMATRSPHIFVTSGPKSNNTSNMSHLISKTAFCSGDTNWVTILQHFEAERRYCICFHMGYSSSCRVRQTAWQRQCNGKLVVRNERHQHDAQRRSIVKLSSSKTCLQINKCICTYSKHAKTKAKQTLVARNTSYKSSSHPFFGMIKIDK